MESTVHNAGLWPRYWAARRGDALAVADAHRRLSARAFEERIARAAGWLEGLGLRPGDRVALLLANRSAYLELVMATARIGAVALPINTRLSPTEVAWLLGDARPALVVHEAALAGLLDDAMSRQALPSFQSTAVGGEPDAYERGLAAATPRHDGLPVAPDDPMILMYTSGTTGHPKGALLPHRKALFNGLNAQLFFGIRPGDRVLVVAPLFHSLGLQILSLPVLYGGGALLLHERFEPERVWHDVEQEGITYLGGVPTMYQRLLEPLERMRPDTRSLRFLFTAGSAIPVDLIHAYARHDLVLKQGYGQTETSILCCLDETDALRKAGSVGLPVLHAEVRVVRRSSLERSPAQWEDVRPGGEAGEIVVRGPITMLGYWERPEATAATLRGEWLRTGDLATLDEEGFVTLVGRSRDMYISGGENVYPAEVEATYLQHPAVAEIAVVGVPDERWGEVGRAHVVPAEGCALDPEALAAWGRERLARFKLPQEFVAETALPRTETGKVQKHRLGGSPPEPAE